MNAYPPVRCQPFQGAIPLIGFQGTELGFQVGTGHAARKQQLDSSDLPSLAGVLAIPRQRHDRGELGEPLRDPFDQRDGQIVSARSPGTGHRLVWMTPPNTAADDSIAGVEDDSTVGANPT